MVVVARLQGCQEEGTQVLIGHSSMGVGSGEVLLGVSQCLIAFLGEGFWVEGFVDGLEGSVREGA